MPKQNLTVLGLKLLLKKPGRHADGGGLYFRTVGQGKAYFVFRYRLNGVERETSLGPYPELGLEEARVKHAEMRKLVKVDKIDPLAKRRAAKTTPSGKPTFGAMADQHVETHEGSWRNPKHRRQWRMTLTEYCGPIRSKPVDEITTDDVLAVLRPIWNKIPESASRLRGRIEVVLDAARALKHIDENKANPARWKGHLDKLLPKPKKLSRGHHAAMPYADLPEFMARLQEVDSLGSRALRFTILTACRTSEVLKMRLDGEIDFDKAVWTIPKERMKMQREHIVPLSEPALAILKIQHAERGQNPHVFPGRPQKPLSTMSMAMMLRRLGETATVHGFRSSFRDWAAETGVAFEVAEQCLAHATGSAVVAAYLRSSLTERRRPVMAAWGAFVTGEAGDNVIELRRTGA